MGYFVRYNKKENRVVVERDSWNNKDSNTLSEMFDDYDAAELRMHRMREAFRKEASSV